MDPRIFLAEAALCVRRADLNIDVAKFWFTEYESRFFYYKKLYSAYGSNPHWHKLLQEMTCRALADELEEMGVPEKETSDAIELARLAKETSYPLGYFSKNFKDMQKEIIQGGA